MFSAVILVLTALLSVGGYFVFKNRDKSFQTLMKVGTLLFCSLGTVAFYLSDGFVWVINGGTYGDTYFKETDILQSFIRWFNMMGYSVLPMAVFFQSKLFKRIALWFCFPSALLKTLFANRFMAYFLSGRGRGYALTPALRYIVFGAELCVGLSVCVWLALSQPNDIKFEGKKEISSFFLALGLILVQTIPAYFPQSLVGYTNIKIEPFSAAHVVWLLLIIAYIVGIYLFFKNKDQKTKYMLCVFLSLVLFFHYNSIYIMGLNLTRLPFQLCNIGAFFFIVCIPLKLEKMFYFCGIANVVGGLVACFALDEQGLIFEFWKVHYFYEHTLIIAIPILVAALGIFPKMTPKKLKYFFIGFTAYFFFCLISGTILNGISDITGRTVNYFFLFDADTALGFFPFMEFIRPFVFKIGKFTFYPGLQITVYIGFQMFCMLYFGVLQLVSKLHDTLARKNQNSMQTL